MIIKGKKILLRPLVMLCCLSWPLLVCQSANAAERIGLVKTFEPVAVVIRGNMEIQVKVGTEIFEGDTIVTDANGAVGIIFKDGAVLTLGPKGKLIVENFLFEPAEKNVSFISKVLKGTVAFASGAIGRISPESVRFETPTATLGLRGTKILIEVE